MVLTGELLPDTERGLIAKAFEKNYSTVASYSVIPTSARVSLEIQEHGEAPGTLGLGVMGGVLQPPLSTPSPRPAEAVRMVPTTPTPPAPTTYSLPSMLLLTLQPWKCTDDTMEIIIARSHLEVRAGEGSCYPSASPRGALGAPGGTGLSPASA